ncbi:MAG: hypothetical protein HYU63_03700 [Armatimonadetes bacterium]|nr:hypothetical protein [Armatimonadota bacterium]
MLNNNKAKDIILITNSPGELSSWVKNTLEKLKSLSSDRIIILLVPCPYASGKEEEIAKNLEGVDLVIAPGDFIKFLLGLYPNGYKPAKAGVVVFLGGDFWHALLIAKKLKFPAAAYSMRASRWNKYFEYLGVSDNSVKEFLIKWGYPEKNIEVAGNLMFDQVCPVYKKEEALKLWNLTEENIIIGIFPGSRLYHVRESLPFFLKAAEEIKENFSQARFFLGLSPFITLNELKTCLKPSPSGIEGTSAELFSKEKINYLKTKNGILVQVVNQYQYDLMNLSALALTIPGTNTAELAVLGTPMIVASSWKAKIPRGGLTGFLGSILTGYAKKKFLFWILKRIKYTALPNQMAKEEIVPEIIVENKAREITQVAVELLKDKKKQEEMSLKLKNLIKRNSSSEKMAHLILKALNSNQTKTKFNFREWVFKWRGWIISPLAILILYIAKPTLLSFRIGITLAALGEILRIWAVGYAGSTTRKSELIAPTLVTAGPYAYLKNPLYLGNIITATGFCIMALGKSTFIEKIILFSLFLIFYFIIYSLIISIEEDYLLKTFGETYKNYSKKVPRIIPRLKPYTNSSGTFKWNVIFKAEIHTLIMLIIIILIMYWKL